MVVQPGGDATATDWNRLVDNIRQVDEATSDRRGAEPLSLRVNRTSSGNLPKSGVVPWPDEPTFAQGIEITRGGSGILLPQPGVYLASTSVSVQAVVERGSRLLVWFCDTLDSDRRYGENTHSLPTSYPIVTVTAVITIREPTEISVWTWTNSSDTLPIYASAVRTMLTVHRVATGGLGGEP